jgi:hypothetical protein
MVNIDSMLALDSDGISRRNLIQAEIEFIGFPHEDSVAQWMNMRAASCRCLI